MSIKGENMLPLIGVGFQFSFQFSFHVWTCMDPRECLVQEITAWVYTAGMCVIFKQSMGYLLLSLLAYRAPLTPDSAHTQAVTCALLAHLKRLTSRRHMKS